MTEKGRSPFFFVTLSSSLAYAVSILPFGKTLDLQGGSSSSQKSRFAAIFGIYEPRSRMGLARCVSVTTPSLFMPSPFLRGKPCVEPCSSLLYRPIQDPSTDARDDKDEFYFQRSFVASLLRMTGRGMTCALPRGAVTNSLSLQTILKKRKNHTFSFFPL